MKTQDLNPRYIADLGHGNVFIFDRTKPKDEPQIVPFSEFVTLDWMKEVGSMAGEAAHFGTTSDTSKAQPFRTQEEVRDFYRKCVEHGVNFRLLPHKDIRKYRLANIKDQDNKKITFYFASTDTTMDVPIKKSSEQTKTDEADLRSWNEAMLRHPYIWDNAKRTSVDAVFYDSKKRNEELVEEHGLNRFLAGMAMREEQKKISCVLSADDSKDKYRNSVPGQWAYRHLLKIEHRLQNHNSLNPKGVCIKSGIATATIGGQDIKLPLIDVMGLHRKKKGSGKTPEDMFYKGSKGLKVTQIVSCAMMIKDKDGQRYINPRTHKPYGFKDIKEYGMVSTPFHQKPGFLRVKLYHNGIKNIFSPILKDFDDSEYLDLTNKDHELLLKFVRNTCRIAYEQTVKALIDCDNGNVKTGLETFAA
tara:strand:+ start:231 stop:1481 length:1251 start_codon:yes stop_codon:yes gene_type:complete